MEARSQLRHRPTCWRVLQFSRRGEVPVKPGLHGSYIRVACRAPWTTSRMAATTSSGAASSMLWRSEEHTSELQSHLNLVCRLLLEKKKKKSLRITQTNNKNKQQDET